MGTLPSREFMVRQAVLNAAKRMNWFAVAERGAAWWLNYMGYLNAPEVFKHTNMAQHTIEEYWKLYRREAAIVSSEAGI